MPRTNLEALLRHQTKPVAQPPANQPPQGALPPAKQVRPGFRAGRAPKKSGASARPASKAAAGDEGDAGDAGDAGDVGEGEAVPLTSAHEAAFARVRSEIDALPREETRRITLHVPAAAMLALGALPKMLPFREAMVAAFTDAPTEALDKLRDYALAAARAHALLVLRDDGESELRVLLDEALPLRERLLLGAELLVSVGLFDAKKVAAIRRGTGRLDAAQDLSALAALFLGSWSVLAAKTPFTRVDVERAGELGDQLLVALGRQQQRTDGAGEPGALDEQLAKAYELFRRAYEECRRAILYLRHHEGDADRIAPPLGQSRRRPRRPDPAAPDGDAPDGDEPGDGPSDGPEAPEPVPAGPTPTEPGGDSGVLAGAFVRRSFGHAQRAPRSGKPGE